AGYDTRTGRPETRLVDGTLGGVHIIWDDVLLRDVEQLLEASDIVVEACQRARTPCVQFGFGAYADVLALPDDRRPLHRPVVAARVHRDEESDEREFERSR